MFHKYENGNYTVLINDVDGTKARIQYDDSADYIAEFPESLDINITQKCDGRCQFCYADCRPDGKHGEIMNQAFIETIRPYTEVALQVNDLSHPDLVIFLRELKLRNIFASITVNQIHFEQKFDLIQKLIERDYVKGLGVSLRNPSMEFIEKAQQYPNIVIHTIAGVHSQSDYEALKGTGLKVLILGFKDKGRGHDYLEANRATVEDNMQWLKANLNSIIYDDWFRLISFDNLALSQLDVKSLVSPQEWDRLYQGDEGTCSMYIDLVDRTFGVSSLVPKSEMKPLTDDITEMFAMVKEMANA